jgi:hypothetical protein
MWSDAVLLEVIRQIDYESRTARADLVRLEADRTRRQIASTSSSTRLPDVKRSAETTATAVHRIDAATDRVERLAQQRAAIDAELVKRALQPEKATQSEGASTLPGEWEKLAADADAVMTPGSSVIR